MDKRPPLLTIFLLVSATGTAVAGQAYTWTDSQGVTHFSESLPTDRSQDAGRIELHSAPVIPGPTPERFRAINDQATRMAAERRKRELEREKRRQLEAERQQAWLDEEEMYEDSRPESYFFYPYWYDPYRRHHRHHRHRHHPPPAPRFEHGKTQIQRRNAEALRNQQHHWYHYR